MAKDQKGTLFLKHSQLIITWPDGREQKLPLINEVTRIGRGEQNDFDIPPDFKSISRQHIEIRREGVNYIAIDLGSTNGLLVNNKKVDKVQLNDNDEIRIGLADQGQELRLRFLLGTEAVLSASVSAQTDLSTLSLPKAAPSGVPHLSIRWPNGQSSYFSIDKDIELIHASARLVRGT